MLVCVSIAMNRYGDVLGKFNNVVLLEFDYT